MIMYCCARDCWRMRWDFVVEQRRVFSRTQGVYTINFFPFFFSVRQVWWIFFFEETKDTKIVYTSASRFNEIYNTRKDFAPLTKAKGRVANKNLQVGQFLRD